MHWPCWRMTRNLWWTLPPLHGAHGLPLHDTLLHCDAAAGHDVAKLIRNGLLHAPSKRTARLTRLA
eukprot:362822-Chlamydomonas_euryale.AAC.18